MDNNNNNNSNNSNSNGIDLASSNSIVNLAMRLARERNHQPLTICIVDRGGHLVSAQREDNSSVLRFEIAFGKAWSCIALGHSTRFMEESMASKRPHFLDALSATSGGKLVPCIGGVLIRDASGSIIGAIGVTGDSAENDEAVALDAVRQCGFQPDLR